MMVFFLRGCSGGAQGERMSYYRRRYRVAACADDLQVGAVIGWLRRRMGLCVSVCVDVH